jgi:hypothetical protein
MPVPPADPGFIGPEIIGSGVIGSGVIGSGVIGSGVIGSEISEFAAPASPPAEPTPGNPA